MLLGPLLLVGSLASCFGSDDSSQTCAAGGACAAASAEDPRAADGPEDNAPRWLPRENDVDVQSQAADILPNADEAHLHGILGLWPNGSSIIQARDMPIDGLSHAQTVTAHTGFCFNSKMSESLSLDVQRQDVRSKACRKKHTRYPSDLPSASVVFIFHNEHYETLLRSVHSVLNRSPPRLLQQVILIDDASMPVHGKFSKAQWMKLQSPLLEYCNTLPKVLLVKLQERRGLMVARMEGVWRATGDAVIFLDSHIEVTSGWIEPLLARLREKPKHLLVPRVDSIDAERFTYSARSGLGVVSFTWKLGQKQLRPDYGPDGTQPATSPIMPGGLFAADRRWFLHFGGYDLGMRLYGGEEMEISFRTWQCGGGVESVPCSHVGHVFRTNKFWAQQVYEVPSEEIARNKLRTAQVWMDNYTRLVAYGTQPLQNLELGDHSSRDNLRQQLGCKSFKWYLKNVARDVQIPPIPKNAPAGMLANLGEQRCLDTLGNSNEGQPVGVWDCHYQHGAQAFAQDKNRLIRVPVLDYAMCLWPTPRGDVVLRRCKDGPAFRWKYQPSTHTTRHGPSVQVGTLTHHGTDRCLTMQGKHVTVEQCDGQDTRQLWMWRF